MPRFHFPIVDGTKLDDLIGVELRNEEQAKKQAELIAHQLALIQASKDARNLVVIDEDGDEVHKVPF